MRSLWRSHNGGSGPASDRASPPAKRSISYDSVIVRQSLAMPGVSFAINRVSFGRRMELSKRVREIGQKAEFLAAGSQLQEQIEAGILAQEIDAVYLRWALVSVGGLTIDGEAATVEQVLAKGPEPLTQEIVTAIKEQCGLSEAERKN
jgi:hypothetical protein